MRDINILFKSILNNIFLSRKILSNIKDINAIVNGEQYFIIQRYNFNRLSLYHPNQLVLHGYYNQYIDTLHQLFPNAEIVDYFLNYQSYFNNDSCLNNDKENRYKRAIYISKFNQSFLNLLTIKKYEICLSLLLSNRFYRKIFRDTLVEDFIIAASKDHHLNIIKQIIDYCHSNIKSIITQKVMDSVLEQENNLEIIEYIYGIVEIENIIIVIKYDSIVKSGNIDVLRFFKNRKHTAAEISDRAMDIAAHMGRLDIVEFLHHELQLNCTYEAMDYAARNGHIHILEFLHLNKTEGCSKDALIYAAANGRIDVMEWILEHRLDFNSITNSVLTAAARNGHLDVIKKYQQYVDYDDESDVLNEYPLSEAAANGHLEIVRYCIETGLTRNIFVLQVAAKNNHMEVVKYLIKVAPNINQRDSVGFELNDISLVATRGHIDMMKYIYSLPNYREKLFYKPIIRHNQITSTIMDKCFKSLELVQWLHHIYNCGDNIHSNYICCSKDLMNKAAYYGHSDIIKFLHENRSEGCSFKAMDSAAANNDLDLVKWLHENRTEGYTIQAIDYKSNFEIVQYLLENGKEGFTSDAYKRAVIHGELDILLILFDTPSKFTTKFKIRKFNFKDLLIYAKNVQFKYPYMYQFLSTKK